MMEKETSKRQQIFETAMEILENSHNGIKYKDLFDGISKKIPDINKNTIHGSIYYEIVKKIKDGELEEVVRLEKGKYILKKYLKNVPNSNIQKIVSEKSKGVKKDKFIEEDFYQPFADYLVNTLKECTKANQLGGNIFQDKWGTPDVIGTYKVFGGIVQIPTEVVSAEIKLDTNQLITAFGQACSYKLFSHKVYLVIPKNAREVDISRIESLCLKFGIGLILFDPNNKKNPGFQIKARALKSEPDYFYLNEYLQSIKDIARELF